METGARGTWNGTTPAIVNHKWMLQQDLGEKWVMAMGERCSLTLSINLASMESAEVFKWFLASVFLGDRIDKGIAMNTYKEFEKAEVLSPEAILETGSQGLVEILDRGGYNRYDFRTAAKLHQTATALVQRYKGDLNRLHFFAEDERDLEIKLQDLGEGIGPIIVNTFLRELRDIWEKAKPPLAAPAILGAKKLGLTQATDGQTALRDLRAIWEAGDRSEVSFSNLEMALLNLGRNYCRQERCSLCSLRKECKSPDKQRLIS
ncbi:MAG: hypothetical protein PHV74_14325 [Dehalococcoidia bacterium]|nr:hypothetical protein [Dehalococcoidia bacterium]